MTTGPAVIRPARPADRDRIRRAVDDAFGALDAAHGQVVGELVAALHATRHARVELVAEVAGDVVGHALLSHSWVDATPRLIDVLVLSPLSVRPDHQGRGVGTALLAAAVAAAAEVGAPALFLKGDPGFYAARGFERGTTRGFTAPSVRIPDAAFLVVVLRDDPELAGALVYCEPFWAWDCVGLRQ